MKKILVFNSGSGSGFQRLVEASRNGVLDAEIVGLVTNNESNACVQRANNLRIPYTLLKAFGEKDYQAVVEQYQADYVALSGWLKQVRGLDPCTTINIHPGPLPEFGGKGMYGHFVHEAVIKAYREKKLKKTEVCMHFVTKKYDEGPVFFRHPVWIHHSDTPETLAERVNEVEHEWQPMVTNLVVNGQIYWDGKDLNSLYVPENMSHLL